MSHRIGRVACLSALLLSAACAKSEDSTSDTDSPSSTGTDGAGTGAATSGGADTGAGSGTAGGTGSGGNPAQPPAGGAGGAGSGGAGGASGGGAGGTSAGGAGGTSAGGAGGTSAGGAGGTSAGGAGGAPGGAGGAPAGAGGAAGGAGGAGAGGAPGGAGGAPGGAGGAAGGAGGAAGGAGGAAGGAGGATDPGGAGGAGTVEPGGDFEITSPGWEGTNNDECTTDAAAVCPLFPQENVSAMINGDNLSPEFNWANAPAGTLSYALVLQDLVNSFVHWVLFNIPGEATGLPAALPTDAQLSDPPGARQGEFFGNAGYFGSGACGNTYEFRLFALSVDAIPEGDTGSNDDVFAWLGASDAVLGETFVRLRSGEPYCTP